MKVRRGEVVIVDFPYSDQTGRKVRPALVVQSNVWNQRLDDTILALITSSRHRKVGATTQYFVDISTDEGQQTGLRLDSVVQCENLITYDQCVLSHSASRCCGAGIWFGYGWAFRCGSARVYACV